VDGEGKKFGKFRRPPYLCSTLKNNAMTLESLLKLAQQYHPSAKITRLVRWGQRVVFYGGGTDDPQFAIDLGLESPIVEPLKMAVAVRPNFVAELLSGYDKNFPLQMKIQKLDGNSEKVLVSSIQAFENFIQPFCKRNMLDKKPTRIEWATTFGPYAMWQGALVTNITLKREIFSI
jgi:hypothetical protein